MSKDPKAPEKRGPGRPFVERSKPAPALTPVELSDLGRAIYGAAWKAATADRLGMSKRMIHSWMKEPERYPVPEPIHLALLWLVDHPEER